MNVEQLVDALSNDKVIAQLTKIFESCLSNMMKKHEQEILLLQDENAALRAELNAEQKRVQELERYSRVDNIIISGLPESYASATGSYSASPDENAGVENVAESETAFVQFCHEKLNVVIKDTDISIAHRLKKGPNDRYRPMIIRFTSRKARQSVLDARKKLRGSSEKVYINEHLTTQASKLFQIARRLWKQNKVASAWTWNCRVYIKKLSGQISVINNEHDLNPLL